MTVRTAGTAGFCFGVREALNKVDALLAENKRVCTLGDLIHNPFVVRSLKERGVRAVQLVENVQQGETLIIRSHGVPPQVLEDAEERQIAVCDATCPFVKKIHRIVAQYNTVIIAGDDSHPEVVGIRGYCRGKSFVVKDENDLNELLKNEIDSEMDVALVAQTTFRKTILHNCEKKIKNYCTNAKVFDTICDATTRRQDEAESLSLECDAMLVVGGRDSANTNQLAALCKEHVPTWLVEDASQVPKAIARYAVVGVTAGASTPPAIIEEVLERMSDKEDNKEEKSFEEALEESLSLLSSEERVKGIVIGIAPNEVQVEVVGRKQAGYIPADELSADPGANPRDIVKEGDEFDLLIMSTNDQEGTIKLSKKRVDALKGWDEIVVAQGTETTFQGTVTNVIKGGLLVAADNGVRIFVPASQASAQRLEDLSVLLRQHVMFRILEVNPARKRAVGSIRACMKEQRAEKVSAFFETAEVGQVFTGKVKSLTTYGAFVDIGGVDGMVHISEMSWKRLKHPSEVMNVGDTVEVYIKGLDTEKGKISLGYRKSEDNPWEKFKQNYGVDSVTDVTIVGLTDFGAFGQIIPGVDGLIHISQLALEHVNRPQDVLKVGDVVKVKITEIDYDKKRISLSMKALMDSVAVDGIEPVDGDSLAVMPEPVDAGLEDTTKPEESAVAPEAPSAHGDASAAAVDDAVIEKPAKPKRTVKSKKAAESEMDDHVIESVENGTSSEPSPTALEDAEPTDAHEKAPDPAEEL